MSKLWIIFYVFNLLWNERHDLYLFKIMCELSSNYQQLSGFYYNVLRYVHMRKKYSLKYSSASEIFKKKIVRYVHEWVRMFRVF